MEPITIADLKGYRDSDLEFDEEAGLFLLMASDYSVQVAAQSMTDIAIGYSIAQNRLRPPREPEPDWSAMIAKDDRFRYGRSRGYVGVSNFPEQHDTYEDFRSWSLLVMEMAALFDWPVDKLGAWRPTDLYTIGSAGGEADGFWGEWV